MHEKIIRINWTVLFYWIEIDQTGLAKTISPQSLSSHSCDLKVELDSLLLILGLSTQGQLMHLFWRFNSCDSPHHQQCGLDWEWTVLNWIELNWIGVVWIGFDWIYGTGLDWCPLSKKVWISAQLLSVWRLFGWVPCHYMRAPVPSHSLKKQFTRCELETLTCPKVWMFLSVFSLFTI